MLQTAQLLQDRYRLDRPLSQTAGRQTWLATDTQTQDRVVVKLLAFSDAVQWDRVRLFEREAAILRQLQHDRIPQYRDQFCLDDRLLWFGLVHDYIPGRSLKDQLVDRGKLSENEVQAIAISVLEILTYLHGLNPPVLHRDIKPSNLICAEDDRIYLIDFGAVQDRIAKEGATFTVVGTYGYVPLEQLGGRAVPASDLSALGATLIHLVTGVSPADLPQEDGRLQISANLSPAFHRWLLRMVEPNLDRRFATALQALQALRSPEITRSHVNPRIKLQKTPQRLTVKLPMSKRSIALPILLTTAIALLMALLVVSPLMFNGWMFVMWLLALGSVMPLFVVWLVTLPEAIATEIKINAQTFTICWKLLGIPIHRVRGKTAQIDRVYQTVLRGNVGARLGIGLYAGANEYRLGTIAPKLTSAECSWLVAEIADWLGLPEENTDAAG